jgi:hypothetical protein
MLVLIRLQRFDKAEERNVPANKCLQPEVESFASLLLRSLVAEPRRWRLWLENDLHTSRQVRST